MSLALKTAKQIALLDGTAVKGGLNQQTLQP